MSARGAAGAALAALAVAGCGESDTDQITSVLKKYNAALVEGDGAEACGLFDAPGRKRLAGSLRALAPQSQSTSCEDLVREVSATITPENKKRIKAIKIRNVKVKGDKATATSGVRTDLVKSGGDWKITNFEGADAPTASGPPEGCEQAQAPAGKARKASKPTSALAAGKTYVVRFQTTCGAFSVRLTPSSAPKAAASVYNLARTGFYDGTAFHRIVPGFVIQGGDPTGSGSGDAGYTTVDPPKPGTTYPKGAVAMAKTGQEAAGTASSQFFVVTGKADLPPDYAVVGRVQDGMDVVERIGKLGDASQQPTYPVVVKKASVG